MRLGKLKTGCPVLSASAEAGSLGLVKPAARIGYESPRDRLPWATVKRGFVLR